MSYENILNEAYQHMRRTSSTVQQQ